MKEHQHAEAIRAYADGYPLEFRVKPGATDYGSTDAWYACNKPDFHPNFEYRISRRPLNDIERLTVLSRIHEGDE